MKRVPIQTPSAPSAIAAAEPPPVEDAPAATTGTRAADFVERSAGRVTCVANGFPCDRPTRCPARSRSRSLLLPPRSRGAPCRTCWRPGRCRRGGSSRRHGARRGRRRTTRPRRSPPCARRRACAREARRADRRRRASGWRSAPRPSPDRARSDAIVAAPSVPKPPLPTRGDDRVVRHPPPGQHPGCSMPTFLSVVYACAHRCRPRQFRSISVPLVASGTAPSRRRDHGE